MYIPDLIYSIIILLMIFMIVEDVKRKKFGDNNISYRNIAVLTGFSTLLFYDMLYHLFELEVINPITFKEDGFDISIIGIIIYFITTGIIIKFVEHRIKNRK